jgi:hypothetical protein
MRTIKVTTRLYASITTALGLCALVFSGCNGPTSSMSSLQELPQGSRAVMPLSGSATPTPIPFKFVTVDDPNSNVNRVTGINQLAKIVGSFGGGSGSATPESYTSEPAYIKFRGANYPDAQGTTATSLTSNKVIAGYVANPQGLDGTWGFIRARGVWTLLKDRKEGKGNKAVTEVLGINDSEIAVGYYLNTSGASAPFVLNAVTEQFTDLTPTGAASSEATGINGKGDISGTETLNSGKVEGFFLEIGTYYPLTYPNSKATQAISLNWQDQIVGEYEDSAGAIHGFILTGPTAGGEKRQWQSVDEPNAAGTTVITGITDKDVICGWYIDGNGNVDGFVGTPPN